MNRPDRAWQIDQICSNAWPPLRQVVTGDWVIRLSGGLTRRANSVNPMIAQAQNLAPALELATKLFAANGQPVFVRVPGFLDHRVERHLTNLGYTAEAETLSLFGSLDSSFERDGAVTLHDCASEDWLASKARLSGLDSEQTALYSRILSGIGLPVAFAALRQGGRTQALAYAVVQDRMLSIDSVVTEASQRNRGYGRRTLQALLAWGHAAGAREVCLQVEADNPAAIALYRKLGLKDEVYRYHYRKAPTPTKSASVS